MATLTPGSRVLAGVMPGVALVSLSATLLDLPRADVVAALDSDHYRIQWIVGSYLAGAAAGMSTTTLAAGLVGLRRAFVGGMLLFTLAGWACGFATEVIAMAPLRLLQGIGAGQVLSPGMVLIWRAFPERRDGPMAIYGVGIYLAFLVGGVLGGVITAGLSWHWLFWLHLPLGLPCAAAAWLLVPADSPARPVTFDPIGFVLFLSWVVALNVTLDWGQYWGWLNSPAFLPWFAVGTTAFVGFVAWGLFYPRPLISLRALGQRNFALGLAIKAIYTANITVLLGLISGYLIDLRGYQWWQGSLIFLPGQAAFVAAALLALPWAEASNRRTRIAGGLILMSLATALIAGVDLYSAKERLAAFFALWGAGAGLAVGPLFAVIFDGLTPAETLRGAGLFNITRALPAFAAAAILATFLTRSSDTHFDRLRQRITHNRPTLEATTTHALRHFNDRGRPATVQVQQSRALLGRWVHANARAYAFQDVLIVLSGMTAVGAAAAGGLRGASASDKPERGGGAP